MTETRITLVLLGLCAAGASCGYAFGSGNEPYLPWLWPSWFALAAICCWVFAARIHSAFWWNASRVTVVLGVLSRVGSVVGRISNHSIPNNWTAFAGCCVFVAAALGFARLWAVDFRYWSRRNAAATRGD